MPSTDGNLTDADRVALSQALDVVVPGSNDVPGAGSLGLLEEIETRARSNASGKSSFIRIVEALSLDMTAHAIGGFSAMTLDEKTSALLNIERNLPDEFSAFLDLVRDVYYEDDRTGERPGNFDDDNELFGKLPVEPEPAESSPAKHSRNRPTKRSTK